MLASIDHVFFDDLEIENDGVTEGRQPAAINVQWPAQSIGMRKALINGYRLHQLLHAMATTSAMGIRSRQVNGPTCTLDGSRVAMNANGAMNTLDLGVQFLPSTPIDDFSG